MKRVVILGSRDHGEKNDAGVLARELTRQGLSGATVENWLYEDLLFSVRASERSVTHVPGSQDIAETDLVIALNWYGNKPKGLRDIAFTLALHLQERGTPFWNSEMLQQRSTTKLSAMWQLAQNGIAVPETVFSLNGEALAAAWRGGHTVVKDIMGSRGRNNHLIETPEELSALIGTDNPHRYMLQEFVPNDYDIRLVCFGGEPRLAIRRQRSGEHTHLNNTSQGGTAALLQLDEIPPAVLDEARQICRLLHREMAGIDYLIANDGSNRYICLEVNPIPQLTSGSFTDEKYAALSLALDDFLKGTL